MSKEETKQKEQISKEQENLEELNNTFAWVESRGVMLGGAFSLGAFILYVTGLVPSFMSIETLSRHWGKGTVEFVKDSGIPAGWGWASHLDKIDMIALAGLAFLSSVITFSFIAIIPPLVRQKDYRFLTLVVLQVAVMVVAAGGWLSGGGH